MRKIFSKLAIVLTTSGLVFPLTACVYNFYVNPPRDAVTRSVANQTSSIIKSLILSKEKDIDTAQGVTDILSEYPNSSIADLTNGNNISNWEEFTTKWGFDGNINTHNFNPSDYFKASGTGSTTQQVNNYRNLNNTLSQGNLVSALAVADNQTLYNLFNGDTVRQPVIDFLNQTKETDPDSASTIIKLLKNTVVGADWQNPDSKAFSKNFVDPLTSLLNYLVKGEWAPGVATPENIDEFKSFMDSWVDPDGKPYSQWTTNGEWKMEDKYYKDWNKTDFNFYRSSALLNHLFYKIGKDYNIRKTNRNGDYDEYKDRYLGDIITGHAADFLGHIDVLVADLNQYFNHLLDNPSYIITLVEILVPIVKHWGLQMSDISQGVKHLTFGEKYKTNDDENSYNIADTLENIRAIITNREALQTLLEDLVGMTDYNNSNKHNDSKSYEEPHVPVPGGTFTYDINILSFPLPDLYNNRIFGGPVRDAVNNNLIQNLLNTVESNNINGIFNNIIHIYNQWIKQYDEKNDGVDLDLTKLQDFLLNEENGLVTVINKDMMEDGALFKIMTNEEPITSENLDEYYDFYKSLGGQINGTTIPRSFRPNSAIDILKKNMDDTNEPLGQIFLILLGKSSKDVNGLFSHIIDSNNQWISDNYSSFFDVTNKSNGQIYNLVMTTHNTTEALSDTLAYNFRYRINGRTYVFYIQAKSWNLRRDFRGTKNFYLTDITFISVRN